MAAGILVGALLMWGSAQPQQTFLATIAFLASLGLSAGSFWRTHVQGRAPGELFLLLQSLFDAGLATVVIHVTGGADSALTPLYIPVLTVASLLLTLPGVLVVWLATSLLFLLDQVVWLGEPLTPGTGVLIALFALVAAVTGWLGERLRMAGTTLGEVESQLEQLRVDTGDILANLSTGLMSIGEHGQLLYMNRAAEALLDLTLADYLDKPVLGAVDACSSELASVVRQSLDRREAVSRTKAHASVRGVDRLLGLTTAVLERPGRAPSITVIFQDITDADRIEALNRRNERLQAVAELSASLAHEIKNPLASIRSATEQLGTSGLDQEDRATLGSLVLSESDRLSRLLSEFIEFARIRSGVTEPVDMGEVVRAAAAVVREHPDAAGCGLEIAGGASPVWVEGDQDLLHRAVFNLLLNAVQFAGSGGTVRLRLSEAVPTMDPSFGEAVTLTVDDSGPGVPAAEATRIFDPFYTTRVGGSGLGLSMVHRAVDAHRGSVFAEASPLGGARFVIHLPAARPETLSTSLPAASAAGAPALSKPDPEPHAPRALASAGTVSPEEGL